MQTRRAQLQALVAQASRVESLPPNAIAPLRFNLVTEIRNATMLYTLDPNKLTEAWLKMLMGFLARLVRTEAAAVGAMKSRYEQDLQARSGAEEARQDRCRDGDHLGGSHGDRVRGPTASLPETCTQVLRARVLRSCVPRPCRHRGRANGACSGVPGASSRINSWGVRRSSAGSDDSSCALEFFKNGF